MPIPNAPLSIAALGLTALACVSTESGQADALLACAERVSLEKTLDNMVLLEARVDEETFISCSAVALAPTLVMTTRGCLTPLGSDAGGGFKTAGERPGSCELESGTPNEDGSFSEWWGDTVAAASISIFRHGGGVPPVARASRIFRMSSSSSCADDIAFLVVGPALTVRPVPLRLDPLSRAGDQVTLSGFHTSEGTARQTEIDAQIASVTLERGAPFAPPRSLVLDRSACPLSDGGAVLSPDTGAVIGILSNPRTDCEQPRVEGQALAVQLAPYRRMLFEAARAAATQELRAELPGPSSGDALPPCGDE